MAMAPTHVADRVDSYTNAMRATLYAQLPAIDTVIAVNIRR
jgi:hypothetical protein